MNVAIFASAFYPSIGGVEELCRQLGHELRRQGHRAIILTNRWPRGLPEFEVYQDLEIHRLAFRVPTGHWKSNLSFRLTHARVQEKTDAILRENKIDLVHVQCVSCQALYAAASAKSLSLPLVVTLQGELTMDAAGAFAVEGIGRQIMRQNLAEAAAVTACSAHTLAEAQTFFGQPFGNRGHVIFNGIRIADFENIEPLRRQRPYVLAMGRHVPQKGLDVLIRAYEIMNDFPMDLLIAGDGPERADLESLAQELKISDRVIFFGPADRKQAVSLFHGCEFFVLPSRQEPFGIVCLEAMACGKPVIATRVGGVPEFMREILVAPESPQELADAMQRLAADANLRQRLGTAGKKIVADFDWPRIRQKYVDVYQSVSKLAVSRA